jgi:hypothetical protein
LLVTLAIVLWITACQQSNPSTPAATPTGTLAPPTSSEFSSLSDLQKAAEFPIWLPTTLPDHLPFYKAWITTHADGVQNVRVLYSEPGNPLDANLKSLDVQMTRTADVISSDSITQSSKMTALDIREVQVRGQTGFTYWSRSGAAGNIANLIWREGEFNFSISLFGNWPQPDENNPHNLDDTLLKVAQSLQTLK